MYSMTLGLLHHAMSMKFRPCQDVSNNNKSHLSLSRYGGHWSDIHGRSAGLTHQEHTWDSNVKHVVETEGLNRYGVISAMRLFFNTGESVV